MKAKKALSRMQVLKALFVSAVALAMLSFAGVSTAYADGEGGGAGSAGGGDTVGTLHVNYIWHDNSDNIDQGEEPDQGWGQTSIDWFEARMLETMGVSWWGGNAYYGHAEYNAAAWEAINNAIRADNAGATKARVVGVGWVWGPAGYGAYLAIYSHEMYEPFLAWNILGRPDSNGLHGAGWDAEYANSANPNHLSWRDWIYDDYLSDAYAWYPDGCDCWVVVRAVTDRQPVGKGGIKILKEDLENGLEPQGDGELDGAEFQVKKGSEVKLTMTIEDNEAETDKNAFTPGEYTVHESKAPTGYNTVADKTVTVVGGQIVTLEPAFKDPIKRGQLQLRKFDDELYTGRTGGTQGDGNLQGFKFRIYNVSKHDVLYKNANGTFKKLRKNNTSDYIELTTNAQGYCETPAKALPYGSYYVKEVEAPAGYTVDTAWRQDFTIRAEGQTVALTADPMTITKDNKTTTKKKTATDANSTAATKTGTGIANHKWRGTLRVQKYDFDKIANSDISRAAITGSVPQGDTTLAGFEFTVQNLSQNIIRYYHDGTCTDIPKNGTFKIVTNNKGIAQTETKALPYGTYKVTETKVPDGWIRDASWSQTFTIRADGQMVTLTNDPVNGQSIFQTAPTLNSTAATVTGTGIANEVWRGKLEIQKRDLERFTGRAAKNAEPEGDATLAGFVFRVYNDSAHTIRYYKSEDKTQYEDIVKGGYFDLTTNDKGYVSTVSNALPYGSYHVVEQSVPDGYYRDANWRQDFTIRANKQVISLTDDPVVSKRYTTTVTNTKVAVPKGNSATAATLKGTGPANKIWRGDIDVWKVDADMADNTDNYAHQNQGTGVFSGCRIAVYNASKFTIRYDKDGTGKLLQEVEPGGFIDAKMTDSEGHVHFSGLPYGTYTVKEISTDEWLAENGDTIEVEQLRNNTPSIYSSSTGKYLLPLDSSITVKVAKDRTIYAGSVAIPKANWEITHINKGTQDKEVATNLANQTNSEAGQIAFAFRNRIQHGDYYVRKVGYTAMTANDPDSVQRVAIEGIKFHIYNYNATTGQVVVRPGGSTGYKEDAGKVAADIATAYTGSKNQAQQILYDSNFTDAGMKAHEVCVITTDSNGLATTRVNVADGSKSRTQVNGWTTPAKWLPNYAINGNGNAGTGPGDFGALAAGDYLVVEEIPQAVQDRWFEQYGTQLLPIDVATFTITKAGDYIPGSQYGHWSSSSGLIENFVPQVHFQIFKTTKDDKLIPLAASFKIQKIELDDNGNETYKTVTYEDNYHNITDTWTTLDNRDFEGTLQVDVPVTMPQEEYILPDDRTPAIPGSVAGPTELYLPFGNYRVIEVRSPDGYKLTDKEVRFTVDDYYDDTVEIKVYFDDEPQMGKIHVFKTDDSADIPEGVDRKVNVEGIEYKVYADEDIYTSDGTKRYSKNDYIQTISTTAANDYYAVTKELYVGLPVADEIKGNLPVTEYDGARYRIEEVKAPSDTTSASPYGYILNTTPIYVTLSYDADVANAPNKADRLLHSYATAGTAANEPNTITDTPQKGKVQITKKDAGTGKIVNQSETDIVFGIYAETDIYTPPYTYFRAGELVDTVTIHKGEDSAWSKDLYVGRYYVQELTAPYGYILDSDNPSSNVARKHFFTIDYTGQENDQASLEYVTVENNPQMGTITITKTDSETNVPLPGAVFKVICDADIVTADGTLRTHAGDVVDTITTGNDGKATTVPLFLGSYHLEEVGVLVLNQNLDPSGVLGFRGSQFTSQITSAPDADPSLSVSDTRNGVPELVTVNGETAKEGQIVSAGDTLVFHDSYDMPATIDLFVGREMTNKTDGGKASITDDAGTLVFDTGKDTYNISSIDRVHSKVALSKDDAIIECPYEITASGDVMTLKISFPKASEESEEGTESKEVKYDEKLFEASTVALAQRDVAYSLSLTENLTLVSGKMWFSENEDGAVELAADGTASITDKGEAKTKPAEETTEPTTETTSGETTSEASSGDAANSNDSTTTEGDETEKPADEEKKDEGGMKWNGIHVDVEFTVTVAAGVAEKTLLNPYTYSNYGYNVNTETYPVTIEYAGQTVEVTTAGTDATNTPTRLELTKTDATNGPEIPGAHVEVTDSEGNVVDSWISTEEPHIIKGIVPGWYTLSERIPPKMYEKAESIDFEVKNDGSVNACDMKDEPIEIEGEIDKYQTPVSYENRYYQYGIDYRSTSNTWADELVMEDKLEVANEGYANVEYIKTPVSFDDWDGYMNVWYKTNKTDADFADDAEKYNASATNPFNPWVPDNSRVISYKGWKIWKADVTTYKSEILEVADLKLDDDEYITGLRFEHGRVESGFTTRADSNEYWDLEREERYGENDTFTAGIIMMYQETFKLSDAANPALRDNEWTKSYHYEPVIIGMVATDKAFEKDGIILENSAIMGIYRNGGGDTVEEKEKLTDEDKDRVIQELHGTPDIGTFADVDGQKYEVTAAGEVHMTDMVKYTGLTPGREYRMEGRLMNAETGQPALQPDGSEIIASATFVPESHAGEVAVLFTFNARALEFTHTVVFEEGLFLGSKPEIVPETGKTVISKADATTCAELPGAILTVKDSDGEVVESWISTEIPHQIALEAGKYTLIENRAPLGYDVNEEVEFEVNMLGAVMGDKVVMYDKPLEEGYTPEQKVAEHSDMNDEAQAVFFGEDDVEDILITPTGDPTPFAALIVSAIAGTAGFFLLRRLRRKVA